MKFSTREDISTPIEAVFETLSSFSTYERAAMRRGAQVRQCVDAPATGLGAMWDTQFKLRGKERQMRLEVTRFDAPTDLVVSLTSRNVTGEISCELFALSLNRTRMLVGFELRPRTLSARLLIQSFKLTKSSMTDRYKMRVAEFVRDLEERYLSQV